MIFVDDLKKAIDIIMHPGKSTAKKMKIVDSYKLYYKVSVVPAIIFVILATLATSVIASLFASIGISAGVATAALVLLGLVFLWILAPIELLIDAAILHLFGKFLLKTFKGTFEDTFAGLVYGQLAVLSLFWVALIFFLISPVLTLLILVLLALWGIVVMIIALANLNKTSRLAVIGTFVVEVVVILIIEFLLFFVGL